MAAPEVAGSLTPQQEAEALKAAFAFMYERNKVQDGRGALAAHVLTLERYRDLFQKDAPKGIEPGLLKAKVFSELQVRGFRDKGWISFAPERMLAQHEALSRLERGYAGVEPELAELLQIQDHWVASECGAPALNGHKREAKKAQPIRLTTPKRTARLTARPVRKDTGTRFRAGSKGQRAFDLVKQWILEDGIGDVVSLLRQAKTKTRALGLSPGYVRKALAAHPEMFVVSSDGAVTFKKK